MYIHIYEFLPYLHINFILQAHSHELPQDFPIHMHTACAHVHAYAPRCVCETLIDLNVAQIHTSKYPDMRRRKSSKRNYYVISPRVIIKAIIMYIM